MKMCDSHVLNQQDFWFLYGSFVACCYRQPYLDCFLACFQAFQTSRAYFYHLLSEQLGGVDDIFAAKRAQELYLCGVLFPDPILFLLDHSVYRKKSSSFLPGFCIFTFRSIRTNTSYCSLIILTSKNITIPDQKTANLMNEKSSLSLV